MFPKSKCINNNVGDNFDTSILDSKKNEFPRLRQGYNGFICPNGQTANWCDPTSADYKVDNDQHVEGMNYHLNNIGEEMCEIDDLNEYQNEMGELHNPDNINGYIYNYTQNTRPNSGHMEAVYDRNIPQFDNYRRQDLSNMDDDYNYNTSEQNYMPPSNIGSKFQENFYFMYPTEGQTTQNSSRVDEYMDKNGNKKRTAIFFMIVIMMLFIFIIIVNIVVASAALKCMKSRV